LEELPTNNQRISPNLGIKVFSQALGFPREPLLSQFLPNPWLKPGENWNGPSLKPKGPLGSSLFLKLRKFKKGKEMPKPLGVKLTFLKRKEIFK